MAANADMPLKGKPAERARLRQIKRIIERKRGRIDEAAPARRQVLREEIRELREEREEILARLRAATDGMAAEEIDAMTDSDVDEAVRTPVPERVDAAAQVNRAGVRRAPLLRRSDNPPPPPKAVVFFEDQ